jgi:hypothetical protein
MVINSTRAVDVISHAVSPDRIAASSARTALENATTGSIVTALKENRVLFIAT